MKAIKIRDIKRIKIEAEEVIGPLAEKYRDRMNTIEYKGIPLNSCTRRQLIAVILDIDDKRLKLNDALLSMGAMINRAREVLEKEAHR